MMILDKIGYEVQVGNEERKNASEDKRENSEASLPEQKNRSCKKKELAILLLEEGKRRRRT